MDAVVEVTRPAQPPLPKFDPEPLRQRGWRAWRSEVGTRAFTHPAFMALLRRFWPTPRLFGIRFITRYDDARETLSRPDVFEVPWAAKMQELAPSRCPFVLGTDDPAEHRCGEPPIMRAFRHNDIGRIARIASRTAERIVERADGTLDAVQDLIAKVPIELYREYYGLDVKDPEFALWVLAMSNYTFEKIDPDPVTREVALAGAVRLARVVDEAIERARSGHEAGDTIIARLVAEQRTAPGALPDDALRSTMAGVITGYLPSAILAGAHAVEVLLERPAAMRAARQAVRDDDDEALARCLLEALRFRPIYPGPWRRCASDHTIAAGTARAKRIREKEKVLVFIQAAMQDGERVSRAGRFDPDRPASDYSMVLGHGMHWCVGASLAVTQMTQALKPLLVRGFRRAPGSIGRMQRFGAIPEHLTLALDPR